MKQRTKKEVRGLGEEQLVCLTREERKALTREEKRYIQKLKNKHSAQRSREERSRYIKDLEEEVARLREQNLFLKTGQCSCLQKACSQEPPDSNICDPSEDLPLHVSLEEQWQRCEQSSFGGYKFLMLVVIVLGLLEDRAVLPARSQFYLPQVYTPSPGISFEPQRRNDVCFLLTYEERLKEGSGLSLPLESGAREFLFADRLMYINRSEEQREIGSSNEMEMWVQANGLLRLSKKEGRWMATRPDAGLDRMLRMRVVVQEVGEVEQAAQCERYR